MKCSKKISLKDNSLITLYAHSALTVASDFNKKSRTVVLKGNAHFDITRNPDKPFIIHNQEMDIEVLGTSFTIQQDLNTVFVHSGKVKATLKNKSVVATAHQKIIIDQKTNSLRVDHFSDMIVGILKTQTIKVKDIRVDSLVHLLENLYNIEVALSPNLDSKKITSTYFIGTETPEQIMENIALILNAKWSKNNNQYFISK